MGISGQKPPHVSEMTLPTNPSIKARAYIPGTILPFAWWKWGNFLENLGRKAGNRIRTCLPAQYRREVNDRNQELGLKQL